MGGGFCASCRSSMMTATSDSKAGCNWITSSSKTCQRFQALCPTKHPGSPTQKERAKGTAWTSGSLISNSFSWPCLPQNVGKPRSSRGERQRSQIIPLETQRLEMAFVRFVPRWNIINSWEHAQLGNTMFWLIFYFDLSQRQTTTNDP